MIDILVYLFETYGYASACPTEPEKLARKLFAAGFEEAEISDAITWLAGLQSQPEPLFQEAHPHSLRVYSEEEQGALDAECRGFLSFLEASGALTASQRECIVERALALPEAELSLSKLKIIVLMVLWQQQVNLDTLLLEELLTDEGEEVPDGAEILQIH